MDLRDTLWFKPLALVFNLLVALTMLAVIIKGTIDLLLIRNALPKGSALEIDHGLLIGSAALIVVGTICCFLAILMPLKATIISYLCIIVVCTLVSIVWDIRISASMWYPKKDLVADLTQKYANYTKDDDVKKNLDYIHQKFDCCGIEKPEEFSPEDYPLSCCETLKDDKCVKPYQTGCAPAIIDEISKRVLIQICLYAVFLAELIPVSYVEFGLPRDVYQPDCF